MTFSPLAPFRTIARDISATIRRYSPGALVVIVGVELIWGASLLIPELIVIASLIEFSKTWTAVIAGFWGIVTFLFLLAVGVFVAYQPSTYVARWREHLLDRLASRYPAPIRPAIAARQSPSYAIGPDVQDAD